MSAYEVLPVVSSTSVCGPVTSRTSHQRGMEGPRLLGWGSWKKCGFSCIVTCAVYWVRPNFCVEFRSGGSLGFGFAEYENILCVCDANEPGCQQ